MAGPAPNPITALRAIVLGVVQGPAELVPVSSSAHLRLVPRLLGWDWESADAGERKTLEVALHAGAGSAMAWTMRAELAFERRRLDRRRLAFHALALAPAALAGLLFERPIERRLGGPLATSAGLVLGALAMLLADAGAERREAADAGPADGLALGLAQASALAPGVSRGGATLTVARWRGFDRASAAALSRLVALPVIGGAVALKASRAAARGGDGGAGPGVHLAGFGAAFATTIACRRGVLAAGRSLWPFAAYRIVLAALTAVAPARPRGAVESRADER